MPTIKLQRSTALQFEWRRPDNTEGMITISPVTTGAYRLALQEEAEAAAHESPGARQERIVRQAKILVGQQHAWFIDELDGEMLIEVIQSLMAVHAGLNPQDVLELQRALKKKTLLGIVYPQANNSTSATP